MKLNSLIGMSFIFMLMLLICISSAITMTVNLAPYSYSGAMVTLKGNGLVQLDSTTTPITLTYTRVGQLKPCEIKSLNTLSKEYITNVVELE